MSFNIGEEITEEEFQTIFNEKVLKVDDKYLIASFIEYQYGELNPSNKVHLSVIKKLEKMGENQGATKGLSSPIYEAKDKDKEKDKVKDKEKEKDGKFVNPDFVIKLFNQKLGGVGKIKKCPSFGLPSSLIEDFKIISGFKEFQEIETWENYFNSVSQSNFLTKEFTPSLAWLLKSENAFKVLGGQYQNKIKNEPSDEWNRSIAELQEKYKHTETEVA
jgi:hypothetical protein